MNLDINYKTGLLLQKYIDANNDYAFYKKTETIFSVFSQVKSETDLLKFCTFLGLSKTELMTKHLPVMQTSPGDIYLNFFSLPFITKNEYMMDYFKSAFNDNFPDTCFGLILQRNQKNYSNIYFNDLAFHIHKSPVIFNSVPNTYLPLDFFNNNLSLFDKSSKMAYKLVTIYNNCFGDVPEIIDFLHLYKQGIIKHDKEINIFLNNYIHSFSNSTRDILLLAIDICNIDVYTNKTICSYIDRNSAILKKFITEKGFMETATLYNTMVPDRALSTNIVKDDNNKHLTLISQLYHNFHSDTQILKELLDTDSLKYILPVYPDFLSSYFRKFVNPDAIANKIIGYHEIITREFDEIMPVLKEKYNFSYYGKGFNGYEHINFYEFEEKQSPALNYILNNNLQSISKEDLLELLLIRCNQNFYDVIPVVFEKEYTNFSKKELFISFLTKLKNKQKIKDKEKETISIFQNLISDDFHKKCNIAISEQEITHILGTVAQRTDALGASILHFYLKRELKENDYLALLLAHCNDNNYDIVPLIFERKYDHFSKEYLYLSLFEGLKNKREVKEKDTSTLKFFREFISTDFHKKYNLCVPEEKFTNILEGFTKRKDFLGILMTQSYLDKTIFTTENPSNNIKQNIRI